MDVLAGHELKSHSMRCLWSTPVVSWLTCACDGDRSRGTKIQVAICWRIGRSTLVDLNK